MPGVSVATSKEADEAPFKFICLFSTTPPLASVIVTLIVSAAAVNCRLQVFCTGFGYRMALNTLLFPVFIVASVDIVLTVSPVADAFTFMVKAFWSYIAGEPLSVTLIVAV